MPASRKPETPQPPDVGITLRQLEYLRAIERTGTFAAAARQCGVSQQSLSEQVVKLESRLGTLVVRSRPRCSLTPLGRQVSVRAAAISRHITDIQRISRYPEAVRIGMIDTIAPYLMPDLMGTSKDRILPTQARTGELLLALDEGRIDGAVLVDGTYPGSYESAKLGEEELMLALCADDPVFRDGVPSGRVRFAEVADREMLMLTEGHCLRDQVAEVCRLAHSPYGALEASTMELLTEMVARDLGVTLVPAMAYRSVSRRDGVRVLPLENAPRRVLHLVSRPGGQEALQPVRVALVALLDALAGAAGAQEPRRVAKASTARARVRRRNRSAQ